MTFPSKILALVALVLIPFLTACDREGFMAAPPGDCTEVGAQCPLGDGPLGVCEAIPCPEDRAGTCFACVSQH